MKAYKASGVPGAPSPNLGISLSHIFDPYYTPSKASILPATSSMVHRCGDNELAPYRVKSWLSNGVVLHQVYAIRALDASTQPWKSLDSTIQIGIDSYTYRCGHVINTWMDDHNTVSGPVMILDTRQRKENEPSKAYFLCAWYYRKENAFVLSDQEKQKWPAAQDWILSSHLQVLLASDFISGPLQQADMVKMKCSYAHGRSPWAIHPAPRKARQGISSQLFKVSKIYPDILRRALRLKYMDEPWNPQERKEKMRRNRNKAAPTKVLRDISQVK
jgi:hypothetical protein